jgi:DNA-directed RNA polymerase subunit RPC12/RpoP
MPGTNNTKYKCQRCGKENLLRSQLNCYTPRELPTGMPGNTDGLQDSQLWATSYVCGACRKALKEGREKVCGAWVTAQRNEGKVPAELEQEYSNYIKYFENATEMAAAREKDLAEAEKIVKIFEDAGKAVPQKFLDEVESCKYNVQQAHAAMAAMEAKADSIKTKIDAIKNMIVTPVVNKNPLPAKAPCNIQKASVVSAPVLPM